MRRTLIVLGAALALGNLLAGCGNNPDDAGNRLIVAAVTPEAGKEGFRFPAVEVTDDVGNPTGDVGTADNGFCDGGDETCEEIGADFATFSFDNETRVGVDEGRPIEVTDIVVNYFDAAGSTPAFAPTFHAWGGSLEVAADGTAELDNVPLTTVSMKVGDGAPASGVRGLFFTNQVAAEYRLTAVVDIMAEDRLNGEGQSVQLRIPLIFHNPNITD
jgi:hypothetical protein